MTSTEEKAVACPTRLIPDQVATEDAFQHKAVATAIADMIRHEDGGGAIALTGAWGSGKSTVVRFLKAELKGSSACTGTFIFDAWAHQGDPLRRTFLEKLIRWCNDQTPRWTQHPDDWESKIEELARRKEITNSKVSPNLTIAGVIGAVFLLFVPLAVQMYLKNTYAEHRSWDTTGLVFSLLPAALATLVLIWWLMTQSWRQKKDRRSIPSFISTGTESTTTSETSKTADPTSVEFEKYYRKLLTEAMAGNDRRLVIVIDNLDRITHDDARSIWATLRVFFDPSVDGSAGWHKRVWILIPFDPEAINDLWEAAENKESRAKMSRHFLEKTFQASFRVPPLILSNWENFLVTQLRSAFPSSNHTDDEFHTIFRLYDQLKPADNGPTTPRNLKLFVNRVGALHRQWQDTIPLTQQAAFALISDGKPEAVLDILLGTDAPQFPPTITQKLSGLLDPEWQRNLAALFFNLPPAAATEALLSPRIYKALNDGDAEALATQEAFPGFPAVLEGIIEDARLGMRMNPEQFAQTAIAFSGLKGAAPEYGRCRNHIYHTAILVRQWQPFNGTVAQGITSIAEIAPPGYDLSPIIRSIRDSLNAQANPKEWCEAMMVALPPLIGWDEGAVKKEFRVQAPATQFLAIIGQGQTTEGFRRLWKYMQPSAPTGEVTGIIAKQAEEGKWDDNASNTVRSLRQISEDWDWEPLIASLRARIQNTAQTLPTDVSAALDTLFYLSPRVQEARAALQAAAQGDFLMQQFYFLTQSGNEVAAAAICVLVLLTSDAQLQPSPQHQFQQNTPPWRANQGKQTLWNLLQNPNSNEPLLKALSVKCTLWVTFERWRETAQTKPERANLINQILQRRLQIVNLSTVTANELIANLDYWTGVAGKDAVNTLLSQKGASGELARTLLEMPFSAKDQQLHLMALEKGGSDKYRAFLSDSLRRLSATDWLDTLKGESEIVDIALSLGEGGLRFGQPLQDALDAHATLKLSDDSVGRLASKWQEVVGLLESGDHEVFTQRLLSQFASGTGRIKGLLPYYEPLLSQVVKEDGPNRSIQRIIQIIETHDAAEVAWLASLVKLWPEERFQAIRADWRRRAEKFADKEKLPDDQREALHSLVASLS